MDDSETRWISTFTGPKVDPNSIQLDVVFAAGFIAKWDAWHKHTQTGKHIAGCNMELEHVWDLKMACFYCYTFACLQNVLIVV